MNQNCLGKHYNLYFKDCCDSEKDMAWKVKILQPIHPSIWDVCRWAKSSELLPQTVESEREGTEH